MYVTTKRKHVDYQFEDCIQQLNLLHLPILLHEQREGKLTHKSTVNINQRWKLKKKKKPSTE